jgi:isopenicillin-N epimerase
VTSWGLDRGFTAEFDLPGTRDPSSHLAAPAAIALLHEWGLDAIRRYNHELAWSGARYLADSWATEFDVEEAMIGTMATVPLPLALGTSADEAQQLRDVLLDDRQIEVQVHAWRRRIFVRISAQIYNEMRDVELLAKAVADHMASLH